eukprot:g31636.t2
MRMPRKLDDVKTVRLQGGKPSLKQCTTAISTCGRARMSDSALELLEEMRKERSSVAGMNERRKFGLRQVETFTTGHGWVSVPCLPAWCAESAESACSAGWPSARCLLLQLRAEGLQQPKAAAESLRGHEKQGPLTGCGHTTINVATLRPWYGALITTLGHEERWEHCLEMMQEMDSQRLESNVILYGAAISACEKAAQWPSAVALLQQQRSEHLESSLICCSAAMTACARGSEWALSLSLLSTTRAAGVIVPGLQVDVIMLSSGISACAQGTEWQGCLALLRDMSSEELCPNQIAYNAAADGLSRCNQWILTLEILREMRQCNLWPDAGTISSAVKSCGLAAEWQHALMAFQQIPEGARGLGCQLWKEPLHRLVSTGEGATDLTAARRPDQLDIVAFHSAVGACEQAGQWEAAVQLLQELRLGRLVADAQILSSALSVAARSGAWDIALALLGFGPVDAAVRNAAISACAQGSRWHVALSLLPSDYVGYCAAISACGATAAWRAAVVVLEDMLLQEMEVDSVAYNALMTSLEGSREWAIGLQLLEQMLASHLRPEEVALAAVLGRLLRHRQVADLPRLLTHLEEEGARRVTSLRGQKRPRIAPTEKPTANDNWLQCNGLDAGLGDHAEASPHRSGMRPRGGGERQRLAPGGAREGLAQPSLRQCTAAIAACGRARAWDKALGILQKMREDGPPPDAFCCNSAIKACNNLKQQLQVFDGMCHLGPSPDIATYGALTSSLGRVARWEDCLEMLRELDSQSLESNLIVYSAAISACDKGSQWQVAIDLLERLEDQETSLVCCSAAMSACARGSQWELALDLLATTRSAGLQFDLIMFSTGISAQGSQWQLSLGLFRELQCQQLPNQIAYNAAADALSRSQNWILTLEFLSEMRRSSARPDASTFSSLIRACGCAALWQEALMAFQQIREGLLWPDLIAYHSAVSACEEAAAWAAALELLMDMRRSRLPADAQILSAAVSAAGRSGEWEMALALLGTRQMDTALRNAAITACGKALAARRHTFGGLALKGGRSDASEEGDRFSRASRGSTATAAVTMKSTFEDEGFSPDAKEVAPLEAAHFEELLQFLEKRLEGRSVQCCDAELGPAEAPALAEALQSASLEALILASNELGPEGGHGCTGSGPRKLPSPQAFGPELEPDRSIGRLQFSCAAAEDAPDSTGALLEPTRGVWRQSIRRGPGGGSAHVTSARADRGVSGWFRYTCIRSAGICAWREDPHLLTLDLSWNSMGDEGGLAMAEMLSTNRTLRHLNLAINDLRWPSAAALRQAVQGHPSLQD